MQRRGSSEIVVLNELLGLMLVAVVMAGLFVFVRNSAEGINFNKNFLARDGAILVNTMYLSPGNAYVYYPINDIIYSFGIGKFEEGYRVKVKARGDGALNEYRYAGDSYGKEIKVSLGEKYSINGLMMVKTNSGIAINDVIPSSEEGRPKERSKIDKILGRKPMYGNEELVNDAREKAMALEKTWPIETRNGRDNVVTSCYGSRSSMSKVTECKQDHCGIDIRTKGDEKVVDVVSAFEGKVTKSKHDDSIGWMVFVQNGFVEARYLHLSSVNVKEGEIAKKWEKIGSIDNEEGNLETSSDRAAHLHFAVLVDGVYFDPIEIGIFDASVIGFKEGSNCFSSDYGYERKRVS